jgi:5-methylcytosine-specific restriction endonuclease McrA
MSKISNELEQKIIETAQNRCGYCLSHQRFVMSKLEIEHIFPKHLGGTDEEENLWLSCGLCNRYKSFQIEGFDEETQTTAKLFNPRLQNWSEHFSWSPDGAEIKALKLNNEIAVEVRRNWIIAGWHPPSS